MAVTKGLVLGKFMPMHQGHIHLIETAAAQVDELTVLVCSIQTEPIPGALRYHWVKTQFPDLRVLHITDENPQEPADHRFFWEIWLDTIRRNCPQGIDVFFSSEDYGDELARRMNIRHVLVDLDRETFPVSGTAVRANPLENWHFIPEVVRPYFIKRVVLTGPESTGKSVLSQKLAEHFSTTYVEEYGRTYCERFGTDLTPLDFAHIAGGHLLREDEAARQAKRVLICDTDLIVTQIWAEIYFNQCPQWIMEMNHSRRYDLFLLMDTDIPWVDDGTRGYDHVRKEQWGRLREELESRNLPYVHISGDFDQRLAQAISAVEGIMV